MPIKHLKVSGVSDGADPTLVQPSDWNADHDVDQYLALPDELTGPPALPATGVRLYSRSRAGRRVVDLVGPSGVDVTLQPALFGNNVVMWIPNTGTTVALAFGSVWTARNSGTGAAQSHPNPASTNMLTSMRRGTFTTGTTVNGSSGTQGSFAQFWRGNAAGLGGFFFFARVGMETWGAGTQVLVGLSALNAALGGEPSVQNNTVAFGIDSTDTNWQVWCRGTVTTKTDTGLAAASGQLFDVTIFAAPNSSVITMRVTRLDSAGVIVDNLEMTTNLPANTTFLYPHVQLRSTSGLTGKALCLNRIYVESDI